MKSSHERPALTYFHLYPSSQDLNLMGSSFIHVLLKIS